MKAIRIFYDATGKIVWTHGLNDSDFPTNIEQDLAERPAGPQCLEITDQSLIAQYNASGNGHIAGGVLIVDAPTPPTPPPPVRDLATEVDKIKSDVQAIQTKVGIAVAG
jgi:hypothetical protein